jgi:hypothetical protein
VREWGVEAESVKVWVAQATSWMFHPMLRFSIVHPRACFHCPPDHPPTHPLPRYLLGTHSDPSAPAPGIFAPCCPHAQTAPRGALHPPWRHHGSWRWTFKDDATGPGRLGWMRAGWNGRTHTGWVNHNIGSGGQGGRVGVSQFMAAAALHGALGGFLPARTFGFGCPFHQALWVTNILGLYRP